VARHGGFRPGVVVGVGVFSATPTGLDEEGAAYFFAKLLMKNSRRESNMNMMKAAPPFTPRHSLAEICCRRCDSPFVSRPSPAGPSGPPSRR
jgi:hypothetical protein